MTATSPQPHSRRSPYVTLERAAQHAQVTVQTVRNWIGKGYLTGYRLGPRQIRVNLVELEMMFQRIPATRVRDGRKVYGRDSKIVPMPITAVETDTDGAES